MIVDCDRCEVRGTACGDCVIGVLMDVPEIDRPIPFLPVDLPGATDATAGHRPGGAAARSARRADDRVVTGGPAGTPVEFAEPERRALQVLADHGLIPHLQLVEPAASPAGPERTAPEQVARPMLPVPVVPPRTGRHRAAG